MKRILKSIPSNFAELAHMPAPVVGVDVCIDSCTNYQGSQSILHIRVRVRVRLSI